MAPSETPFDLRWRAFGISFRVHPSFWIFMLIFGYLFVRAYHPRAMETTNTLLAYLALWVGCAFASILIHELGHVTLGRIFGAHSNILLYSMGGLAIGNFDVLARWQRIGVSLAGPAAGFSLCGLAWVLPGAIMRYDPVFLPNHRWVFDAFVFLFIQNLFWNLFNLVPIIPLDGGMVMREVVTGVFPSQGMRLAYGFSFLIAGSIAVYSLLAAWRNTGGERPIPYPPLDPVFNAFMFGMFAFSSFTTMRALEEQARQSRRRWSDYEEREW
jgi:Zn-dependent protease